ncbi:MAG TPA: hypothetical protein VH186_08155 [Chloroflexia bacterium]|nr:hypothetical protein [Chloroflexia bacterium]
MEKDKLAAFEKRLLDEKERLEKDLDRMENEIRENTSDQYQEGAESDDAASDVFDLECILTQRDMLKATLSDVNKALQRVHNGTYGYSEISGKPIPEERLEVLPWATRRVEEQREEFPRRTKVSIW